MTRTIASSSNLPVYQQIVQDVRDAIEAGRLGPGAQLPPQLALAQQMKVNPTTVRRAYELLEQQGMIVRRQGLGTFVNEDALAQVERGRLRAMSRVIMICGIDDISQAPQPLLFIQARLQAGFHEVARGSMRTMEIMRTLTPELADSLTPEDVIIFRHVDHGIDYPVIAGLLQRQVRIMTLLDTPACPGVPHLDYDLHHAVVLACEHLIAQGYTRIGYLGHKMHNRLPFHPKFVSFLGTLNKAGLTVRVEHTLRAPMEPVAAYAAMRDLIARGDLPEAFFVDTDYKAMEAVRALADAGLRVPEDIGIVAYDDLAESATFDPPLTTVHTPQVEIGQLAAKMLLGWACDGPVPPGRTLQARLVERKSTRTLRNISPSNA